MARSRGGRRFRFRFHRRNLCAAAAYAAVLLIAVSSFFTLISLSRKDGFEDRRERVSSEEEHRSEPIPDRELWDAPFSFGLHTCVKPTARYKAFSLLQFAQALAEEKGEKHQPRGEAGSWREREREQEREREREREREENLVEEDGGQGERRPRRLNPTPFEPPSSCPTLPECRHCCSASLCSNPRCQQPKPIAELPRRATCNTCRRCYRPASLPVPSPMTPLELQNHGAVPNEEVPMPFLSNPPRDPSCRAVVALPRHAVDHRHAASPAAVPPPVAIPRPSPTSSNLKPTLEINLLPPSAASPPLSTASRRFLAPSQPPPATADAARRSCPP